MKLCAPYRQAELLDEVEGEIAIDACQVEILGEDQHKQNAYGEYHRRTCQSGFAPGDFRRNRSVDSMSVGGVPSANLSQKYDANHRKRYEEENPRSALLSNDQRGKKRPEGRSSVSPDLKERLCEPATLASGHVATRDDSGWNTDEPTPMSDTENRSIPKL